MLCKDCKYCKTKSVGHCGSSRSYCNISSGSIAKGTRLGINLSSNKEHPKCPLKKEDISMSFNKSIDYNNFDKEKSQLLKDVYNEVKYITTNGEGNISILDNCYTGIYENIPFVELTTGNYLFVVDDEKWDLESISNWSSNISKCLPDIKFAIVLKSMFTDMRNITDEQYEYINNIIA